MSRTKYKSLYGKKGHPNANKNGRIYEHRYVMAECLGRPLRKGEVVHHKNGDRSDNRIENLELVASVGAHTTLHSPNGCRTFVDLECAYCGKSFKRDMRQVSTKRKAGQTRFYCSRKCMGHLAPTKNFTDGEIKHGSSTSYSYWGCRCDVCRTAHAGRLKKWRKKQVRVEVPPPYTRFWE